MKECLQHHQHFVQVFKVNGIMTRAHARIQDTATKRYLLLQHAPDDSSNI
jgi:hypothetical protein